MGITTRTAQESPASELVQWFLDYYWIRHPISQETVAAWRAELLELGVWLGTYRNQSLVAANAADLRSYLDARYRAPNRGPNSTPSLSCIKRFYFYLVESGIRADDPTELVYIRTLRPVLPPSTLLPVR